ncbi:LacI family DNA-binding transcriptional regulator [Phytoactinopolyspora limicola]|uniref:LacI family DNA-binding transcriptional regulator n=1 Tax=Phytoactinopolyspora limicola TaxID=2715536 RepID=UPI00140AFD1C|nr:LacI family DNA-binding transcriptional regulator [Phytoactinopolyspora limicola]
MPDVPPGKRRRRATQADVAKLAGVSRSVVSTVINGPAAKGSTGVGPEAAARVWAAIREVGYVPNIAAQNLAHGRSKLVGVFTYEAIFPVESISFYHQFLIGIEQEADALGYNLLMFTSSRTSDGRRAIYLDGSNSLQLADGAIILGGHKRRDELARLATDGFPFVIVGRREIPGTQVSYVAADYASGIHRAVQALVERGHRRIAMTNSRSQTEAAQDRRRGFERAVRSFKLAPPDTPVLTERNPNLLGEIEKRQITAVLTESSGEARNVCYQARQAGWDIPAQLSVVSLGGLPGGTHHTDVVAELSIPRRDMGRESVRILADVIADPDGPPIQKTLDCHLDLSHTVAPAP